LCPTPVLISALVLSTERPRTAFCSWWLSNSWSFLSWTSCTFCKHQNMLCSTIRWQG
jgi:hypothetical protein